MSHLLKDVHKAIKAGRLDEALALIEMLPMNELSDRLVAALKAGVTNLATLKKYVNKEYTK